MVIGKSSKGWLREPAQTCSSIASVTAIIRNPAAAKTATNPGYPSNRPQTEAPKLKRRTALFSMMLCLQRLISSVKSMLEQTSFSIPSILSLRQAPRHNIRFTFSAEPNFLQYHGRRSDSRSSSHDPCGWRSRHLPACKDGQSGLLQHQHTAESFQPQKWQRGICLQDLFPEKDHAEVLIVGYFQGRPIWRLRRAYSLTAGSLESIFPRLSSVRFPSKKGTPRADMVEPISWYFPHVFNSYPKALPRVTFQDLDRGCQSLLHVRDGEFLSFDGD